MLDIKFYYNIIFLLTLTRPIGLPPNTPVAQKIADKRWLAISNDVIKGSVNKHRFFSSISFILIISYMTIWLKTDLDIKTHWQMKGLKLVFFKRCASKNGGGQGDRILKKSTPSPWKCRKTTWSATFCWTGVWGLNEKNDHGVIFNVSKLLLSSKLKFK